MITTAPNIEQTATEATGETTELKELFRIDSENAANWLLKKLAAIEGERLLIKVQAVKREGELKADYDSLMGRFGADLRAWAREEADRRRRQGVTLEYGNLNFRAQAAKLIIISEPDAMTTARAVCPGAVTTETIERFDREAFLAYAAAQLQETGELLPGIDRLPEGESFSVAFPKAGSHPAGKGSGD